MEKKPKQTIKSSHNYKTDFSLFFMKSSSVKLMYAHQGFLGKEVFC